MNGMIKAGKKYINLSQVKYIELFDWGAEVVFPFPNEPVIIENTKDLESLNFIIGERINKICTKPVTIKQDKSLIEWVQ